MLIIGLFLMIIGIFRVEGGNDAALGMLFIGVILLIIAEIYYLVLLYRVWRFAIDESHRHNIMPSIDTPGKAVGFLFIPFFNWYWVFQVFGKLPKDLNAIAHAKQSGALMSNGLGTTFAIMSVLSIIPFIGTVTGIIALIIAPIFISQSITTSRKLSQAANA
jgi:hypothetical protein